MSDKSDQTVTDIDKALAAAKARKDARTASGEGKPAKAPKAAKAPTEPKRPRLTDEEKAARAAKLEADRTARKAERDANRAQKLAERNAARGPAHLKKVIRAAERLGALDQAAQLLFNEATTNLTAAQLTVLANHILHFNREKATLRALTSKVEAGQTVTIIGGDARFIGKTGTVTKAQRIRCYVAIEGVNKPVYCFSSDVEVTSAPAATATA
jgi:hypothetical protein